MMFPYLPFIFQFVFYVVDHPVGRSMIPSDMAHSVPTGTLVPQVRIIFISEESRYDYWVLQDMK